MYVTYLTCSVQHPWWVTIGCQSTRLNRFLVRIHIVVLRLLHLPISYTTSFLLACLSHQIYSLEAYFIKRLLICWSRVLQDWVTNLAQEHWVPQPLQIIRSPQATYLQYHFGAMCKRNTGSVSFRKSQNPQAFASLNDQDTKWGARQQCTNEAHVNLRKFVLWTLKTCFGELFFSYHRTK